MSRSTPHPLLDDHVRQRVLSCLLLVQRHSWDQGVTAAALEDAGAADQLRVLREVWDDASAAAALAVFSKFMRNYPDAKWALDGWWALQHAGKTLERRGDAAYCRRLALGQALSFARDTWLHAESQRWTAKATKAKAVYELLKAAQI